MGMPKVHFIAIGGSAMHNLAIALHDKGYMVTGSDDEIFEPSLSRLKSRGLLPEKYGWFPQKINSSLDAVILGMHATEDNTELIAARQLGLKIFSYPEYLYQQTRDKIRVVIGGSHGKTTITSMVMHVLKYHSINFDYMVGAQLENFDTMVRLSHDSKIAVFEGDEYLASTLDKRPKFHLYKPNIALLSGIAWDHINVFPSFEMYVDQFRIFTRCIEPNGALVYYKGDEILQQIASETKNTKLVPYSELPHFVRSGKTFLKYDENIALHIFGQHNLQNLAGALEVCRLLGISDQQFYQAVQHFKGASKRLQKLAGNEDSTVFLDFAHSPSKLGATVKAVKEQFPGHRLIACMELHTFSSLNKSFLSQYTGTLDLADEAIVYFNPNTIRHKRLEMISAEEVKKAFNCPNLLVYTESNMLIKKLQSYSLENTNLLLMSSGNFDGINLKEFARLLLEN